MNNLIELFVTVRKKDAIVTISESIYKKIKLKKYDLVPVTAWYNANSCARLRAHESQHDTCAVIQYVKQIHRTMFNLTPDAQIPRVALKLHDIARSRLN